MIVYTLSASLPHEGRACQRETTQTYLKEISAQLQLWMVSPGDRMFEGMFFRP